MGYLDTYRAWRASAAVDEETKRELAAIENDPAEIEDRFYRSLSFGTAGLRGVLGVALVLAGLFLINGEPSSQHATVSRSAER